MSWLVGKKWMSVMGEWLGREVYSFIQHIFIQHTPGTTLGIAYSSEIKAKCLPSGAYILIRKDTPKVNKQICAYIYVHTHIKMSDGIRSMKKNVKRVRKLRMMRLEVPIQTEWPGQSSLIS